MGFYRCLNRDSHTPPTPRRALAAGGIAAALWDRSGYLAKVAFGALCFSPQVMPPPLMRRLRSTWQQVDVVVTAPLREL